MFSGGCGSVVIATTNHASFSLLEYLKRESRLLSGLEGLGIPSKYFVQMVSLSVHPQHSTFAVDMRNDSVLVSMTSYDIINGCDSFQWDFCIMSSF